MMDLMGSASVQELILNIGSTVSSEAMVEGIVVLDLVAVSEVMIKTVVGIDVLMKVVVLSGTVLNDVVGTDIVVVSIGIVLAKEVAEATVVPEPLVDNLMVSELHWLW